MQNRKKLNKGFVFTFEAILALLLFVLILFTIPTQINTNLKELLITEQANDLLRVWSQTYPTESQMIFDTKLIFENKASVIINNKELTTCTGKNKIATEGTLLNNFLLENRITIIVCYE